jgi:hypothetical protein
MTTRIRLSRAKGWRLPEDAVSVDRRTLYGNPFAPPRRKGGLARVLGLDGRELRLDRPVNAAEAVAAYRAWLDGRWATLADMLEIDESRLIAHLGAPPSIEEVARLRGARLACWCPDDGPCHAVVLLEIANGPRCERVDAQAA